MSDGDAPENDDPPGPCMTVGELRAALEGIDDANLVCVVLDVRGSQSWYVFGLRWALPEATRTGRDMLQLGCETNAGIRPRTEPPPPPAWTPEAVGELEPCPPELLTSTLNDLLRRRRT